MRIHIVVTACLLAACGGHSTADAPRERGIVREEAVSIPSGAVTLAGTIVHPASLFARSPSEILSDPTLRTRVWFRAEANYDPRIALRKLTVPALFLFGEDDELVPVAESVAIIEAALSESGHRDFSIKVFPQADHAIYVSQPDGGRVLAPGYLETMARWLARAAPVR